MNGDVVSTGYAATAVTAYWGETDGGTNRGAWAHTNAFPGGDDPNAAGNHRKNLTQSLEASLRRLNVDYIDLYWVHARDFTTPIEEVMRGLDDLDAIGHPVELHRPPGPVGQPGARR